jgi:hypothetical protein
MRPPVLTYIIRAYWLSEVDQIFVQEKIYISRGVAS